MNQNSEHINHDSALRWNKTSTQQQTNPETLEQQKSNSWTPVGPTKDRSSGPSQLNWKLYAGAIIKSEAWPKLLLGYIFIVIALNEIYQRQ